MADKHYYVSQQNGSDSNDGLSPSTAWATLTKARSVTYTPGYTTYIHIGPGTYRERITLLNGATSASKIIWAGDPDCRYLINDRPGTVRITGCDAQEAPTSGTVFSFNYKDYVELWYVVVDGSTNNAAVYMDDPSTQACYRVKAYGYYAFFGGVALDCVGYGYETAFNGVRRAVNCIGWSKGSAFTGAGLTHKAYGCIGISAGGGSPFFYMTAVNCLALGGYYPYDSCRTANCAAFGVLGSFSTGVGYPCINSWVSGYQGMSMFCPYYSSQSGYGSEAFAASPWAMVPILGMEQPLVTAGLRNRGWWNPYASNTAVTGATVDLTSARTVSLEAVFGTHKGAAIYIEAKASAGNVTVELQKDGVTQASKTLNVADLVNLKFNRFEWPSPGVAYASGTWSLRITADADAQATTIRTSDGAAVSYIAFDWPSDMPDTDIQGKPRLCGNGYPDIGPWAITDYALDWTTYQTKAPAIKINLKGQIIYQIPVKGGEAVAVKWQVRHHGTADTLRPQILLRGLGITEQVATHSGPADSWQELSVSATPAVSGVLECVLYARDTSTGAYSHFSDPVVS